MSETKINNLNINFYFKDLNSVQSLSNVDFQTVKDKVLTAIESLSGVSNSQGRVLTNREIYRHPDGNGSVIVFDMFGKTVELLVLDAKYRSTGVWSPDLELVTELPCIKTDVTYLSGKQAYSCLKLESEVSDKDLQERYPTLKEDQTAANNTKLMGVHPIMGYDIPNMYELMVIHEMSDRIDELDPTLSDNTDLALGYRSTFGRFSFNNSTNFAWSSTQRSDIYANSVGSDGCAHFRLKDSVGCFIPVKELSISD